MPSPKITAVVTTIPPRVEMLDRALASIAAQTLVPTYTIIERDDDGNGAMVTRNKALARVRTEWVAFLDDDDEWLPHHLQALAEAARQRPDGDLFYSWYEGPQAILAVPVKGQLFSPLGVAFGAEQRDHLIHRANFIPVTAMVRADRLRRVGGFQPFPGNTPDNPCEDWGAWRALLLDGAVFVHVAAVTWRWYHHGANTSGQPRWKQATR